MRAIVVAAGLVVALGGCDPAQDRADPAAQQRVGHPTRCHEDVFTVSLDQQGQAQRAALGAQSEAAWAH